MANEDRVYVTKSGRVTKRKFDNYTFTVKRKKKNETMPVLPDERPINNEAARRRELEVEQAALNRQREELEQLRRDLEAQRAIIQQHQQQDPLPAVNNEPVLNGQAQRVANNEDIATIISNVSNFRIDINMPTFKDESEKNPVEFLEEMDKFFKLKNIKAEKKMMVIEHALTGRASLWFETKPVFETYEGFRQSFLDEFYAIPSRVQFKNNWMDRRYNAQKESLQTYYYQQIKDARYFIPKLTEYEVNYSTIQQYPVWVKETLATVDYNDSGKIGQTLGSLDSIRRERERNRESKQVYNHSIPRQPTQVVRQMNVGQVSDNSYLETSRSESHRYKDYNYRPRRYNNNNGRYQRNTPYSVNPIYLPDTRFPPPGIANSNQQASVASTNFQTQTSNHLN